MLLKYLIIPEFPSKSVNTVDDAREVTNELINSMWESSILNLGACMENIYENIYLEKLLLTIVFISLMFAS